MRRGLLLKQINYRDEVREKSDWGERWPSGLGRRPATGRSMVRVPLR